MQTGLTGVKPGASCDELKIACGEPLAGGCLPEYWLPIDNYIVDLLTPLEREITIDLL